MLKISLDNLCAPTKQQTRLLTVVPPHQVTQDSPVLPFCVACDVSALLTLDLAVQLVVKIEQHLRIIESFPAKAEGVPTSPGSQHPATAQFPDRCLSCLLLGRNRDALLQVRKVVPSGQVEDIFHGNGTVTVCCLL